MASKAISKETSRALRDARKVMEATYQADCNEAETRQRVERIFERLLGYDYLTHLSRERAIQGAGGTEHVDFAIQLDDSPDSQPVMLVELKRVGLDLAQKHLKQAAGYAIDCGCEWVLLTNGRDWRLYHVEFGKPPETKLVARWNLLKDEVDNLAAKFELISLRSVRQGRLGVLWKRTEVLQPGGLLAAILAPESTRVIRRIIKRDTGVAVAADDVVGALRRMLNESAARVLQDVQISLPSKAARVSDSKVARDAVRMAFWTRLLDKASQRTPLHSSVSPGPYNWVGATAGRRGLSYLHTATKHRCGVELYIDLGKGERDLNKRIYDALHAEKPVIEAKFGGDLVWERLDDKRASRVSQAIDVGGYADEGKWPEIQKSLVELMVRFEAALSEHVNALS